MIETITMFEKNETKSWTIFCWSVEVWAVQKACKFGASRQELSNEYSLFTCKIGVDTADNEPFDFHNFS